MMFALIDAGLAGKNEHDTIEQFSSVFEFDDVFGNRRRTNPIQFTLPLLFIVITISAIFVAGLRNWGFRGGLMAVTSSWFALVGGFCVFAGIRDTKRGRMLLFIIGIPVMTIGVAGFCFTVFSQDYSSLAPE